MTTDHKPIQLKFSCGQDWNAMTPVEGGRHCHECRKTVYDFTDSKPDEFRKILAEHGYNVCGRFDAEHVSVKSKPLFWKRWVTAAMLLLGFGGSGCKDSGNKLQGEIIVPATKMPDPDTIVMGKALLMDSAATKGDSLSPRFPPSKTKK